MSSNALETAAFLRKIHPADISPYWLLIWTMTGQGKLSRWFRTIADAASFVQQTKAEAIYVGVGLSPADLGPYVRCKTEQIVALPGLVCDLDIRSAAHSKEGLPPDIDSAKKILPVRFPPTLLVDSGHGLHGWWLFRERWDLDSNDERVKAAQLSQRWHNFLSESAARLEYVIDAVYDLARVLRLPGTVNRKIPTDCRLVRVVQDDGIRYNPSELEDFLDAMGVPEIQVLKTDDHGRVVEYGDLRVDPRIDLGADLARKIEVMRENSSDFRAVWDRSKRMPKDNSWSGYAQSIANHCALVGLTDQQIIDVLTFHRKNFGDPGKRGPKPLAWFIHPSDSSKGTVNKARAFAATEAQKQAQQQAREAKAQDAQKRKVDEGRLLAEAGSDEDSARQVLFETLELKVKRLVQIGTDVEPAYRLELEDGQIVQIPSLTAITSFSRFNRYIWRYLRTALPVKAKGCWRAVSIALAKLIVVEDTGLGDIEVLFSDLGEYFSVAENTLFEEFPVEEYPNGPPEDALLKYGWQGKLRVTSEAEYKVALSFLALPQKRRESIYAVCWPTASTTDTTGETVRVVFKLPPLYDWLRTHKDCKYEADELSKRLSAAGFTYRESGSEYGVRLRRVWRGLITEAAIDEHQFETPEERWGTLLLESARPNGNVQ